MGRNFSLLYETPLSWGENETRRGMHEGVPSDGQTVHKCHWLVVDWKVIWRDSLLEAPFPITSCHKCLLTSCASSSLLASVCISLKWGYACCPRKLKLCAQGIVSSLGSHPAGQAWGRFHVLGPDEAALVERGMLVPLCSVLWETSEEPSSG